MLVYITYYPVAVGFYAVGDLLDAVAAFVDPMRQQLSQIRASLEVIG